MTQAVWTIERLRTWTCAYLHKHGSTTARLDADLLLCEVLKLKRLDLYCRLEQLVSEDELAAFKLLVRRRAAREPLAYILGRRGFHALELAVDPRVLVPRPETESLVDAVLVFLRRSDAPPGPLLDLCAGSGAIGLALAHALTDGAVVREVWATDLSADALAVAEQNRRRLALPIQLFHGDLWAALPAGQQFAVIASNPPYVCSAVLPTLEPEVRVWEPVLALDGGADGLDVLGRIAAGARGHLLPRGLLALELGGPEQARAVCDLLAAAGLPDAVWTPVGDGPTALVQVRAPG